MTLLFQLSRLFLYILLATAILLTTSFADTTTVDLNPLLVTAMKAYKVPVVGYAIIKNYQIVAADTISIDPSLAVFKKSIFQAASLSKTVSAYGVLKLVSDGKLNLDEPVNTFLKTWKIPTNQYNENHPVTVRQLLNMTSGLSVAGFAGYPQGNELPTLQQLLDGQQPATNPPIRVFYEPGSQYFYSAGAFEVLQKMIEDVAQEDFATWIDHTVLTPLGMNQSIFQYPLNERLHGIAVPGFLADGSMIHNGWKNYPSTAANGLWTTPTDLANLAIDMAKAIFEDNKALISPSIAEDMLKRGGNTSYGLGLVINGEGEKLNFRKAGDNTGYHSEMLLFPESGDGAIVMTNSENGEYIINYLIPLIASRYNWPCYFPFFDENIAIPQASC